MPWDMSIRLAPARLEIPQVSTSASQLAVGSATWPGLYPRVEDGCGDWVMNWRTQGLVFGYFGQRSLCSGRGSGSVGEGGLGATRVGGAVEGGLDGELEVPSCEDFWGEVCG